MIIDKISTAYPAANCFLCWDEESRLAVLIDPPADVKLVEDALTARSLTLRMIFLTHGHFDHIFGVDVLRRKYSVPLAIHEEDADMLCDPVKNASMLFFNEKHVYCPADILLHGGEEFVLEQSRISVLHTPGHSPGSVCYCMGQECVTGDALFRCSIGRTDLPGGDDAAMQATLMRLSALPDDIAVYPGHGEISTMAYEKKYNPYLQRRL